MSEPNNFVQAMTSVDKESAELYMSSSCYQEE